MIVAAYLAFTLTYLIMDYNKKLRDTIKCLYSEQYQKANQTLSIWKLGDYRKVVFIDQYGVHYLYQTLADFFSGKDLVCQFADGEAADLFFIGKAIEMRMTIMGEEMSNFISQLMPKSEFDKLNDWMRTAVYKQDAKLFTFYGTEYILSKDDQKTFYDVVNKVIEQTNK